VARFVAFLALLAALAMTAAWYSLHRGIPPSPAAQQVRPPATRDLKDLYNQNPREAQKATARVAKMGPQAIPAIRSVLTSAGTTTEERKAALKAAVVLGPQASPLVPEVAKWLDDPDLTEEAAVALSFMGRDAFPPLRGALDSTDPIVRREALRSIGKLRFRAPLDGTDVVKLLDRGMTDQDPGVRTVAATYLGILHEDPTVSVPTLTAALDDPDLTVRRAAASALGSFGEAGRPALPALRKAAANSDDDLAREAGRAIVRIAGTSADNRTGR
jgi:HEAT repeat protein